MTKEDFGIVKRQQNNSRIAAQRRAAIASAKAAAAAATKEDVTMADAEGEKKEESAPQTLAPPTEDAVPPPPPAPPQPWELVDEIMNNMKSSFPLLTLTMEKMVDQIAVRAKPASDEDIYRFFAALLADALQVSTKCWLD